MKSMLGFLQGHQLQPPHVKDLINPGDDNHDGPYSHEEVKVEDNIIEADPRGGELFIACTN